MEYVDALVQKIGELLRDGSGRPQADSIALCVGFHTVDAVLIAASLGLDAGLTAFRKITRIVDEMP
jgi:hypothetical protein